MQQQLWHLLRAGEEDKATVRVLPSSVGPNRASASGAFTILEFPSLGDGEKDAAEPPTVYCENLTGALYLDKPHELEVYEQVWKCLDSLALSAGDSNRLIDKVLREMNDK